MEDKMEGRGVFIPPAKDIDFKKGKDSAEQETLEIYQELAGHLALSEKLRERLQGIKEYANLMKKISEDFAKDGVDTELGIDADDIKQKIEQLSMAIERVNSSAIGLLRDKNMEDLILERGDKIKNA
jgi:hypothetical protein